MPLVAVRNAPYENVREPIEEMVPGLLGDVRGKKVLLKPNMLAPFPADKAITTHPAVVKALCECLAERGASVIVGDNPGVTGYGMNERVAKATGILDAVGPRYRNLASEATQVTLAYPYTRSVVVSKAVLESDIVISVPKFKTHSLTVFTGSVKNMFGIAVGGEKAKLHTAAPTPQGFAEIVAEVFALRPPDLTVMDAVVAMEGNGPSAGRPRALGALVFGKDGVAVDAAMIRALGFDPYDVAHLRAAEERGLGAVAEEAIEIDGRFPAVERFRLPATYRRLGPFGTLVNALGFRLFSKPRLKIDRDHCSGCGVCESNCPAGAIRVEGESARVDESECAACYLCHEVCPESAVRITGLLGRMTGERRGG